MGCQKITENIEKGKITKNSVSEKVAVRLHLSICKNCRKYARDSRILDRMITRSFSAIPDHQFTKEEKAEIVSKLR